MNIKKNLDEVKKELTSDEQMLMQAFKIEKFYKKHKVKIISVVAGTILFFGGRGIINLIEEYKLNSANEAYLELLKNENNTKALAVLKENNPKLFELYSYNKSIKNRDKESLKSLISSKNNIISDVSSYHLAIMDKTESESELYREMSAINNAYNYIKKGNIDEAKNQLELIDERSPLYDISIMMKHYTIKGK